MAELRATIVGENKTKKAFDQVSKSTNALDKSVKRLGASFLAAFSVQKLATFSKNAVKAFAENEKSARRLETVVKNLGLAFEIPGIEASLDRVSAKFGYEGEVLREAFQKLITTTGSAKKSQDLLNLSLDIAAGSGIDFLTVNQDLAAAYVGQTRGLRKYNLGLTQSELKTLDFESAIAKLSANFKGAAGNELETYSGKMRVLQEAAGNAQEIIGGGLIDALMILSGDTTIEDLAATMEELATNTATALTNLGKFGQGVKNVIGPIATGFEKFINATQPFFNSIVFGDALTFAKPPAERKRMGGYPSSALGGTFVDPNEAARKKAEAAAAKRAKELAAAQGAAAAKALAAQKRATLEQKKANALNKAARTLDLTRIGIAAALKNQISETDRLSLNLQLALLDENDALATKLSGQLETAIERQAALAAALEATPDAPNPFKNWIVPETPELPNPYRNWKIPDMGPLGGLAAGVIAGVNPPAIDSSTGGFNSGPLFDPPAFNVPPNAGNSFDQYGPMGGLAAGVIAGVNPTPSVNVTVTLDGTELTSIITNTQVNDSLSGSFSTVNRTSRFAPQGVIPD
jgi:hypothetical protein